MIILKYFSILLGLILVFTCCKGKYENHIINDVSKESVVLLESEDTIKGVYSLSLLINGRIDGSALIVIKDEGTYKKEYKINGGKVELKINEDWYSPKCTIEYYPFKVKKGELKIGYKFFEL